MRILFKLLLWPLVFVLSLIVAFGRFLYTFSSILLSVLSGLFFFFAVGNLIMGEKEAALGLLLIGFFISPFGLPALALWMVEKLDDLKEMIREL